MPKYLVDTNNGEVYAYNPELAKQPRFVHFNGNLPEIDNELGVRIAKGYAAEDLAKLVPPTEPTSTEESTDEGEGEEQMDALLQAIADLEPEDFSPATQKPNTKPLEELVGFPVSAALRDEAWDLYNEE